MTMTHTSQPHTSRPTASSVFASDNAVGAHPSALAAIMAANADSAPSYGQDCITSRAVERIRDTFQCPQAEVLFAFTGTGANIIALTSAVRPWHEILCSDIAHVLSDEAGGLVRISGATLTPLPSDDGIIDPAHLDRAVARRGDVHHCQPHVVSITQSTENGRVWNPTELSAFIDHAHRLDLVVHIDGARLANAIAAAEVTPQEAIGDADIITIGGTKNGMLCGDAIVIRRPEHFGGIEFIQKQLGHLASKNRFLAAQFDALLHDNQWLSIAAHANAMAARLAHGFTELGLRLSTPVEANEVFVDLPPDTLAAVRQHYSVHVPNPHRPAARFVCSWATSADDVDTALEIIADAHAPTHAALTTPG